GAVDDGVAWDFGAGRDESQEIAAVATVTVRMNFVRKYAGGVSRLIIALPRFGNSFECLNDFTRFLACRSPVPNRGRTVSAGNGLARSCQGRCPRHQWPTDPVGIDKKSVSARDPH